MSDVRDPAIKLFGKTILMQSNDDVFSVSADAELEHSSDHNMLCSSGSSQDKNRVSKNCSTEENLETNIEVERSLQTISKGPETSLGISNAPTTSSADKDAKNSNSKKDEQSETSTSQEKPLKKPDKIIPCPRCNSMETKFCYFNNYNVNQPRHFCKNCQRYWTAGGTMRNVPVGAGRRKNKTSSVSNHRHLVIPEGFHAARPDTASGIIHPVLRSNGTVLAFGTDLPLCESMTSALNLADKTPNSLPNVFPQPESRNGLTHQTEKDTSGVRNITAFPHQVPCFPAPAWPYAWNSAVPPAPFMPPGFPMSFYAAPPYWPGCGVPGPWNLPWPTPASISSDHSSTSSSPNSPTLGKHSRDGSMLNLPNTDKEEPTGEKRAEGRVLVPKTLRIDDPNEAAKSSIWATLGIKNDKGDSTNRGGLFKGFQSKGGETNSAADKSRVLQANPAALSRSLTFQESAR